MRTLIRTQKLTYHGISNRPAGGWNYTIDYTGECIIETLSDEHIIEPAERVARARFPEANRMQLYERKPNGGWRLWFSGYL
jgi:hypothetical protein